MFTCVLYRHKSYVKNKLNFQGTDEPGTSRQYQMYLSSPLTFVWGTKFHI